jgi:hypothetical protein
MLVTQAACRREIYKLEKNTSLKLKFWALAHFATVGLFGIVKYASYYCNIEEA